MLLLSASEWIFKIVDGFTVFINGMGDWDWDTITTLFKNLTVSGGVLGSIMLFVRTVIPLLKNSNKETLKQIGELLQHIVVLENELKTLKNENATVKDGLLKVISYAEVTANINLTSKTITDEQRASLDNWLAVVKPFTSTNEFISSAVTRVEEIISDNKITIEEGLEIIEKQEQVKKVMLTPLSQVGGKV